MLAWFGEEKNKVKEVTADHIESEISFFCFSQTYNAIYIIIISQKQKWKQLQTVVINQV